VRTNLEYVPEEDWPEFLRRMSRTAKRLIVCHYHAEPKDVAEVLQGLGFEVEGTAVAPSTAVAWCEGLV